MYEPFVQQCVARPQYALLQRGYEAYRANSLPCQRGVTNQCAVRMSIALGRAGFGFESFSPRARVHSGGPPCGTDNMEHLLGAQELANFLKLSLGNPTVIRPQRVAGGCAHAFSQLRGQTGIVYFNNCFSRATGGPQVGDHIDLFNGTQYYNQILHPRAGGDEGSGGDLFGRADQIWFWRIS